MLNGMYERGDKVRNSRHPELRASNTLRLQMRRRVARYCRMPNGVFELSVHPRQPPIVRSVDLQVDLLLR